MIIGQSKRLVRLVPSTPCTTDCARVAKLRMAATGPGYCDQGSVHAKAKLTVTDETGAPQAGVRMTGHFLDDYWLDRSVDGRTDTRGQIRFRHHGPPCVGAIAFLVTGAAKTDLTFDRTAGSLADFVIPESSGW